MTEVMTVTDALAGQVRKMRQARGWSVRQLAEECARLGVDGLTQSSLANIERGQSSSAKRKAREVTVPEVLALATALSVAPVHLVVPFEEVDYLVTPSTTATAAQVRAWIRGEQPLAEADIRAFRNSVPEDEWSDPDRSTSAQMQDEAARHFAPGINAALNAGLTEDEVLTWVRGAYQLSKMLRDADGKSGG